MEDYLYIIFKQESPIVSEEYEKGFNKIKGMYKTHDEAVDYLENYLGCAWSHVNIEGEKIYYDSFDARYKIGKFAVET